jgi:hypothetical protein
MNKVKRVLIWNKTLASYTEAEVKNCLNSAFWEYLVAEYRIFNSFFLL